jgi:redox-sensitive bicupin YhaK (pirin superfamily)
MTAGKGIVHSERAKYDQAQELEGIQLWIALPKEQEDVEPRFDHYKEKDLPFIEKDEFSMRLIAGKGMSLESPVPVFSDLFYYSGKFKEDGVLSYPLEKNQEAAIYVISGEIEIEGEKYNRFDMIVFKAGSTPAIKGKKDAQFMFFGGEILPEKRHIWWNFVSSEPEKIEQAKKLWENGEFGEVINETEFIPLPSN